MTRSEMIYTVVACVLVFAMTQTAYFEGKKATTVRLRTSCDADKFDLKPEYYQPIREERP